MLLTEKYETYFGFLTKNAAGKYPKPDESEPQMALWVVNAPEIDDTPDGDDPTPTYSPKTGSIHLGFETQQVQAKDFFAPRRLRSVYDLLGTRVYIEFRTYDRGWLPLSIQRAIRPSLIDFSLSGRRTLQFHERNLTRVTGRTETHWVFDFPNTMEELRRKFEP
jgi:hypothetical protein